MPSILRSRMALFALLGAFLIPIATSNLRGLTHILTCEESAATPFTLIVVEGQEPQLLSSTRITRGQSEFLCGGLSLNMGAKSTGDPTKVAMVLPITNHSDDPWRGTVTLNIAGNSIPADIGEIAAGETETDTLTVNLDPGSTEVEGNLLIGP